MFRANELHSVIEMTYEGIAADVVIAKEWTYTVNTHHAASFSTLTH